MYISDIVIQNFRCFDKASFRLNHPAIAGLSHTESSLRLNNVNLFLGGNGAGKSSCFKAIAISVLHFVIGNSGYNPEFLVRRRRDSSSEKTWQDRTTVNTKLLLQPDEASNNPENLVIPLSNYVHIVQYGDTERIESPSQSKKHHEAIFTNYSPAFFLVGYGANRRTERPEGYSESSRSPRYQRVASLFEDHVGMVPFTYAALQLSALGYWTQAKDLLNNLLPDEIQLTDRVDSQKRPLFDRDGILLPFPALSDGFRTFVGWVWDLLYQIALVQPSGDERHSLVEQSGVVIVDEIDLFLHPEWQRLVIEQVARAFPRLQFLFSSHSPLVAGTLEPANIFVLETDDEGAAVVKQYEENIYGLTANQVLTSSYFGLASTRAPGTGTLSDTAARKLGFTDFAHSLPPVSSVEANGTSENDAQALADRMVAEIAAE